MICWVFSLYVLVGKNHFIRHLHFRSGVSVCVCVLVSFSWTSEGAGRTSRHSHSYIFHIAGGVLMWSVLPLSLCTITFQVRISTTSSKIICKMGGWVAI